MLSVSVNQLGDVVVIDLAGEFDIEVIRNVEKAWNEALAKNPNVIGFNCKELKFIDSSAIGTLVKFMNSATNRKITLTLFNVAPPVITIFKTSRLDKFFSINSKEEFEKKFLPVN
ncbi:MAG: STAS domain-containing protein [Spirochaetota bacterium]